MLLIIIHFLHSPTPEDEPLVQILSRVVSKDGKTPHGATPRGGVWTLRSQEGRLYLFNSQDREKEKDDDPEEEDTEEGIELSSLLAEENGESCVSLPCLCQCSIVPFKPQS